MSAEYAVKGNRREEGEGVVNRIRVRTLRAISALMLCLATAAMVAPSSEADFGFTSAGTALLGSDGGPLRQAGSHPNFETQITFNRRTNSETGQVEPDGLVRDVRVDLPPGMVGAPTAAATCTPTQLLAEHCPLASQIGFVKVLRSSSDRFALPGVEEGLFNMTPAPGQPAQFAFLYSGAPITIVPEVRPSDYGISALSVRASQAGLVFGVDVMIWGVPADHSHDLERRGEGTLAPGATSLQGLPRAFFREPTSCAPNSQAPVLTVNSWEHPEQNVVSSVGLEATPFEFSGCDGLPFNPSISIRTSSRQAQSPTGLSVDLSLPQSSDPEVPSTADLRKARIVFPLGMAVSSSAANGLGACSQAQIGIGSNAPPSCPDSSKIGTVRIKTPLLAEELEGSVILAKQDENPFGSLLAMYLAIKGPGFYLKLPGKIEADPVTGQLTSTFSDTPQLPFEDLKLELEAGPRAPLVTPPACGTYDVHSELTSWASESETPVQLDTPMTFDEGCDRSGFGPGFEAGTINPIAGAFSAFTLQVTRNDDEQNISRIETTLPEGLLAKLNGVPLCADAQAAGGDCPASSQVGTTTVGIGAGPSPVYVPEAGKTPTAVYLAGPYKGAPYSLVVKVPAQAGPFDLGTVTVRNGIYIDPTTTQVTVRSDPLPQILEGIPVSYRGVRVEVSRNDFTVNPTSCRSLQVTSTITSIAGQTSNPSSRFQVANCASLKFTPKLTATTSAKTSRADGASLSVKLAYPAQSAAQANVASVKVDLPKQLPSRLTTLQKACTAAVFAANPASCPAASVVGHATVSTPLLAAPLSGPAYFVSHGGEAFPSLTMVLQGNGVTVQLAGSTFISRAGITSTTFKAVPDVPFSTFALTLPRGRYSALTANGSLCNSKPVMPTALVAQNGAQIKQSTKIALTGCPKAKKAKQHVAGKPKAEKRAKR